MALAATRARLCAAGAAAVTEDGARVSAAAARAVRGVVNMPSRSIAAVLLRADAPVPNGELYAGAREYGLLKSHRHFKHTLRMMKEQRRVQVIPGPPERVGGRKLTFRTKLTRRGQVVYSRYLGEDVPLPGAATPSRGLADAVPGTGSAEAAA